MTAVRIRIEGSGLPGRSIAPGPGFPGYEDIQVAVQPKARGGKLLAPQPGDADSVAWTLDCTARPGATGTELTGPWIQGRPGQRFVYLWWDGVDDTGARVMFRRAKLMLDAVDPAVLEAALAGGTLTARLTLTDLRGHPLCAAVRPPSVTWSAG